MDKETKFLTTLYQSSKAGSGNTAAVLSAINNEGLRARLIDAIGEYDSLSDQAAKRLFDSGHEVKKKNPVMTAMTEASSKMMASMNNSHSHIAEMMINGANMGIIDMTKAQNDAPEISADLKKLGDDFIALSRRVIAEMKPYL